MATPLADRHCVACEPGTPPLPQAEVGRLLAQLDGWEVDEAGGHLQLVKAYQFKGFMTGVEFINRIAPIAEREGHHPDILLRYGSVTIQLWTHAAGGLTDNDFILAAKIDEVQPDPAARA
jgi:4a-hydroxytetrahydrobiopterin dehydratase